jgi:hypothetical protein
MVEEVDYGRGVCAGLPPSNVRQQYKFIVAGSLKALPSELFYLLVLSIGQD